MASTCPARVSDRTSTAKTPAAGPTTPAGRAFSNLMLHIDTDQIAGTPIDVALPPAWNGSLCSLYQEFQCYLIVAGLAMDSWVRRSPVGVAVGGRGGVHPLGRRVRRLVARRRAHRT